VKVGFPSQQGRRPEEDAHDAGAGGARLQACHDGVEQQHGGEDEDPAGAWDVAGGQGEHEDASENDDMDKKMS
jgi:hypothetical protein